MADDINDNASFVAMQSIFSEELDQPGMKLELSDNPETIADWDSLAHIRIMTAIEAEFGFQFELKELEDLHTVGEILSAVTARQANSLI